MDPTPVESLGPPPFRFLPSTGAAMRGPAFSIPFKLLATAIVAGSAAWAVRLWSQGQLGSGLHVNLAWFLAALAMMAWSWWCMVTSVTTLDTVQLHQTWVWNKRMELRELAYAKLIRVRGLDWLIAPRLYVRTLPGKFAVFYAADPALAAEFERLVAELKAFRNFR
ncbi:MULTISPECIES: hypothetical protein [Ramlibacter]|uniref:PH domain-containing protein n=1 Tax=Ramlibacter pinisoli TaxID=2682844 RepID=A0A6N8IQI2_9BURK|nr:MULTISPECIES: hypothetical protein [Ramlibacter]MBA2964006.1 hypothetical protein [Ramlibacter sp. CGMCC 1.13660]MVQ28972.1 hypothetical protein [Ramlibacter pinisoli]